MTVVEKSVPIEVTLRGRVGRYIGEYAQAKVAAALTVAPGHVEGARLVLDVRRSHADGVALAEAVVVLDGRTVTAKSSAPTMLEAVDRVEARLRRQLLELRSRTRDRARRGPRP
jgi:ribosome-associated translation inhibitor RaiA